MLLQMHMPHDLMASTFVKTSAGAAEMRLRAQSITRAARDLLFVIDGSRTAAAWAALIHGTTDADIKHLVEKGLIANAQAKAQAQKAARVLTLDEAIATLSYE